MSPIETILNLKFLPIIDLDSLKNPFALFDVMLNQGVPVLQVNFRSKNHLESASLLGEWSLRYPELQLGAGFLYSSEDAELAIRGGAKFIVSSVMAKEILTVSSLYQIPAIISGLTPTEIYQAQTTGTELIQLFPASQAPLRSVSSLLEHMPNIKLMLTGGLTLYTSLQLLRIGIAAVGVKGSIFQKELLETQNYRAIADSIKNFYERIHSL
ncbi:2-dehydro-3-deoxyphosphogluconate aldolase / (4S)-4-hydroxy-2-oxoglutarate aldolase [Brevinema andersonii]|uniref:2-dehydro-3-deoxyphosphogluconate aldolase / (4S)-4-hydroxy-2-oxoglutarate aldolase n=1 Tax=Brevinema andersonii TaxID=34097 RepID=A0A1I1DB34_BREAD|nr:bifunctional 4-hydroxy-2-oxoglutarate aldolase/2-dehydro-3-deoxy-phosphogluconate aldolase [Brevinema andersonii]SFB72229.1 2-dehydro-3-deoxyphosphogluconate aldolase / (4S)-4-hydroxy-2-oxoglutarate aldolase [Brevinema andersonii]